MLVPCPHCHSPTHAGQACLHCSGSSNGKTPLLLGATALLGLTLAACTSSTPDSAVVALYGVPDSGYMDNDGDGHAARTDCDDDNADIYPGAPETAGDGVDSNCNDEDDT